MLYTTFAEETMCLASWHLGYRDALVLVVAGGWWLTLTAGVVVVARKPLYSLVVCWV